MAYIGSTPTSQNFIAGTDYFNGTGSQTAFTLTRSVNSVNDIEIVINNVIQQPNSYTVSGTTLTISAAPSSGTSNVYVRYLSTTLQSITVPANSIDSSKLASLSTIPVTGGYTATLPAATGTVMVSGNMPAFSAYPSASSTNISSSTWTKVTLDTEVYDTNSNFASSRFTPTVAGYYQINFTANLGTSANNGLWFGSAIYKNGSAYAQAFPVFPAGNVQSYTNNLSQVIYMNGSSDYVEFYVNVYVLSGTPNYGGSATTGTLVSGCLVRTA